jgi:hypothetical protein
MNEAGLGQALAAAVAGEAKSRVTLGDVVAALRTRGYGLLLLLLVTPNLVPGPAIPGFSTLFALPLLWVATQMALGVAYPQLPGFVARLGIERGRAQRAIAAIAPWIARIETLLRPRAALFTGAAARRWIGLVVLSQGVLLLVPIPVLPMIPSCALLILALGLMAEDGVAVACGLVACAAGTVAFAAAFSYAVTAFGLA